MQKLAPKQYLGFSAVVLSGCHALIHLGSLLACGSCVLVQGAALDRWNWRTPLPQGSTLRAVAYGNTGFVAVGEAGTILSSTDGVNWSPQISDSATDLNAVTYGGGRFVAVGYPGETVISADGVHWNGFPQTNLLLGITCSSNLFVAVGTSGRIVTSPDGVTWSPQASGLGGTLNAVTYANGKFIAVGEAGVVLSSPNGTNWSQAAAVTAKALYAVTSGQGLTVAAGESTTILTSSDGVTWTNGILNSQTIRAAAFGNGKFIVTQQTLYARTSTNAIDWILHSIGPVDKAGNQFILYGTAFGNGRFVTVGSAGVIVSSTNGINWIRHGSGIPASLYAVTHGGGRFIAVGFENAVYTSGDGVAWTNQWLGSGTYRCDGVAYGNGTYVIVGQPDLVFTSTNLIHWAQHVSAVTNFRSFADIIFAGGQFVAVSGKGAIQTSVDGTNWIARESGTTNGLRRIAFGNGTFVAAGERGVLVRSTDGTNWLSQYSISGSEISGVGFGANKFVATDFLGTLMLSSNGSDWTITEVVPGRFFFDITYENGGFVGVVSFGIYTSPDGLVWTSRARSRFGGYAAAYGNRTFVVAGGDGQIIQSDDVGRVSLLGTTDTTGFNLAILDGELGRTYRVQAVTNASQADWADVFAFASSGSATQYLDSPMILPQRFYRVVSP